MWTSKLGNKYEMAWMQENDKASQAELKRLRSLSSNSTCADCASQDNSWASVSHGVFICVTCSDVHRSVGTHITKVKGCTGTYLWGPDELEKMRNVGNGGANAKFGSEKIGVNVSKEQKQRYVVEKYEKLSFAGKPSVAPAAALPQTSSKHVGGEQPQSTMRRASGPNRTAAGATQTSRRVVEPAGTAPLARAAEVSDSWFDDFFNDDSYSASTPVKSSELSIMKCAPSPCLDSNNSLDAFLNDTLHIKAEPAPVSISAYPTSLDPFQKPQPASVTDPFFDWPEF